MAATSWKKVMPRFGAALCLALALAASPWNAAIADPVIIEGVPDYQQIQFSGTNTCTPVASACIFGFWNANGYPNMIDGSSIYASNPAGVTALVDMLKATLEWSSLGTYVHKIPAGLRDAATARGYTFNSTNISGPSWSQLTTQIDAGRPPLFTMLHSLYGGLHSTTLVGYTTVGSTQVAIVHDNWHSTAKEVHLNFAETSSRTLTSFVPVSAPIPTTATITVESDTANQVAITASLNDRNGAGSGNTQFTRVYDYEASIVLSAPLVHAQDGKAFRFTRWTVSGSDQPEGQQSLSLTLTSDLLATAGFELLPPETITDLTATMPTAASQKIAVSSASSSSNLYNVYVAGYAIDNNANTFWSSSVTAEPVEAHLTLDLGATKVLGGVRMLSRAGFEWLFPSDFHVQVSSDAATWTTLHTENDYQAESGQRYERRFTATRARYIRCLIPATNLHTNGLYYAQMAEFEAYGARVIELDWTAPGGYGDTGVASSYEIRRASSAITTEAHWNAATPVSGAPVPGARGSAENMLIDATEMYGEARIHFAARAVNADALEGPISNAAYVDPPTIAPALITDLEVASSTGSSITISFTAVGDDGHSGTAAEYDIRYYTEPITNPLWNSASILANPPAPQPGGTTEMITISGLQPKTTYHIRMRVRDAAGNNSDRTESVSGSTGDDTPPAAITDLEIMQGVRHTVANASATSSLYNIYVPSNLIDGNPDTFWSSQASAVQSSAHVIFDLGSAAYVGRVRMLPRSGFHALFPSNFSVQIGIDGVNWQTVASESVYAAQSGEWYDQSFPSVYGRYIRLLIHQTKPFSNGMYYAQVSEFEAFNQLSKVPAVAASGSSALYNSFTAANAIDNDSTTFWSSQATHVPGLAHLIVDLGTSESVVAVRLLPRARFPELFPVDFSISLSIDGADWTIVHTEEGYQAFTSTWFEAGFPLQNARYVRLDVPVTSPYPNGMYYVQVAELEVYKQHDVSLSWTAPGDDGMVGTAQSYMVRRHTQSIATQQAWDSATPMSGAPAPAPAGGIESMPVSLNSLPAGERIYFSVKAVDAHGNEGGLSNSVYLDIPAIAGADVFVQSMAMPRKSNLVGDVNGDCQVTILDMILVRSRIGQPAGAYDSAFADVNGDGVIDINDMLLVRDNLGRTCDD